MIRIAIGTERRTEIARKVLEFSILSNTKSKVKFYPLMGEDYYDRGDCGEGTGFSILRFTVPELFDYQGRAIYLDADQLVLADIKELWDFGDQDLKNVVWCTYGNESKDEAETSVMVINNERARGKIKTLNEIKEYLKNDKNRKKYREIMKLSYLQPRPKPLPVVWNIMDKNSIYTSVKDFSKSNIKLLHYTSVPNQPWFTPSHPASHIWGKWFKKAFKHDYITIQELKEANKKYSMDNKRRPDGIHSYWLEYLGV